jgi:beta-N-acetylhexosaminidase
MFQSSRTTRSVMPGPVPGIHVLTLQKQGVDGRDKPGHDEIRDSI